MSEQVSKMADHSIYNIVMASGSALSFLSNLLSYLYIRKTYNTVTNSLYFLLAADAIVVSVVSLGLIGFYTTMSFYEVTNELLCGLQMLGYPMIADVMMIFGFCISLIRRRRLRNKLPSEERDARELKVAIWFISGFLLYFVMWVILSVVFDLKMFHMYNICLHSDQSEQTLLQSMQALVVCAPVVFCYTGTIVYDCQAMMILHRYNKAKEQDQNDNGNKPDNVALRGSIVAGLMILPMLVICPILGFVLPMGTSDVTKYYISFGITLGSIILRNPFVSVFTHKVNETNKRKTAHDIRAANMKKVLDEANERQAMLMASRSSDEC